MINVRMGAVAASKASGSIPPGPYTNGTYYYVFVNKVNLWFKNISGFIGSPPNPPNRWHADNLSYDLYQKPNSSNQSGWRTIYTYLTSSLNPNGNVTNCNQFTNLPTCNDGRLYRERKQGYGKWLTTVNVTVTNGYASFSFPNAGTSSYITYPENRGGAGFYTASLINGGWIP